MECIFLPDLQADDTFIDKISIEESKHLKALHINSGDNILAVNGKGFAFELLINRLNKNDYSASVVRILENYGENEYKLGLAIGILDDSSRLEFALEKSIELGISDFYPLITKFSQKKNVKVERLVAKSIAAIKQCKRSKLPIIHPATKLDNIFLDSIINTQIILADEHGDDPRNTCMNSNRIVFVGPEGGFNQSEIELIKSKNPILWKFGNRRLRAETAAVAAISFASC